MDLVIGMDFWGGLVTKHLPTTVEDTSCQGSNGYFWYRGHNCYHKNCINNMELLLSYGFILKIKYRGLRLRQLY